MRFIVASGILLLVGVSLTACGSKSTDDIDYKGSEVAPTLEMPPDIIRAEANRNLELPGSSIGTAANTGRFVQTGNVSLKAKTLPRLSKIQIQGQGDIHWLSVPEQAELVYPMLREFWLSEGFELQLDEPIMGMMKTQWTESKASSSTGFFGRMIESMRAAEHKHQYTTRIERNSDDSVTRIFIAHREQELIIDDSEDQLTDGRDRGWQFVKADPNKEYEMLSRMMVFLGLQDEQAKEELERIGGFAARAAAMRGNAEEQQAHHLAVNMGFEQTWNRLMHQLTRLDVTLNEVDRKNLEASLVVESASFFEAVGHRVQTQRQQLAFTLEGHSNAEFTRIEVEDRGSADISDEGYQILLALLPLVK